LYQKKQLNGMTTITTTFSKASSAILTMSSTSRSSTETVFSTAGVETTTTTMFSFGTINPSPTTATVIPTFFSTSVLDTTVASSITTFESTKYHLNFSYLNMFTNGIDTSIFSNTNPAIQTCNNIDKVKINDNQFNMLSDYPVGIHLYNLDWVFNSTFYFPYTFYATVANNFYYFTIHPSSIHPNGIVKTSVSSPAVLNYYGSPCNYRGLFYDDLQSRIIAAGCEIGAVQIFDLDLNLINSVLISGVCPHDVTMYNTKIYVAIYGNGNIVVISNDVIENTVSSVCTAILPRISVDSFGYFALSCSGDSNIYLYDSVMQYTNKYIAFNGIMDARFDTNDRFAICGGSNLKFYTYSITTDTTSPRINSQNSNGSFLSIFTNSVDSNKFINSSIIIQSCVNVETATINNIEYNLIVDQAYGVYLYDLNWNYHSNFNFTNIYYAISVNNFYYFTLNPFNVNSYGIVKSTIDSTIILNSYGYSDQYRGLYYDSNILRIIAAGCGTASVDIFDLNLNLITSIVIPGTCPHGVAVYNSKIYVSLWHNGAVVVISNGSIENQYSTQCSINLARLSIDDFGYIALSCPGDGYIYLFDSIMQYTNKYIAFPGIFDARLDLNDELISCGNQNVKLYIR
jgi:hypothetical protein